MQEERKIKRKEQVLTILLFLLLALAVYEIDGMADGVRSAMTLCARAILPTLFPFLILSDLLLSLAGTQRVLFLLATPLLRPLRLSAHGATAFLLGALFGFPIGPRIAARYYSDGVISREEAERLLLFSGNASPFFLIGSVGGAMLSSLRTGMLIYLLQLLLSLLTAFLLARFAPKKPKASTALPSWDTHGLSLSRTVQGAVKQSLVISGYVLVFSALSALFLPFCKGGYVARMLLSLLEIGGACAHATAVRDAYSVPFCAFAASFSGLSVYFQTRDVIEGTTLSTKRYLPIKLLTGAAAFFLALLFLPHG